MRILCIALSWAFNSLTAALGLYLYALWFTV
jgi:hypothetical protein